MKPNKKNINYFWLVFFGWAILIFILCCTLPTKFIWLWLIIPMFLMLGIPLYYIFWYYTKTPEGREELKEAKEMQEYKRLVKECEKEDRKAYRRRCREKLFDDNDDLDDGFIPMDNFFS